MLLILSKKLSKKIHDSTGGHHNINSQEAIISIFTKRPQYQTCPWGHNNKHVHGGHNINMLILWPRGSIWNLNKIWPLILWRHGPLILWPLHRARNINILILRPCGPNWNIAKMWLLILWPHGPLILWPLHGPTISTCAPRAQYQWQRGHNINTKGATISMTMQPQYQWTLQPNFTT